MFGLASSARNAARAQIQAFYLAIKRKKQVARVLKSPLWPYAVAVLLSALALWLTLLIPNLSQKSPFLVFITAVILSAFYGGLGPGLVASGLSLLSALWLIAPSSGQAFGVDYADLTRLAVFVFVSLFVSWLAATRRRVEEDLRKLSRAVEQSPATVVITDTAGRIEYVNPKFTQLTGYTLDEARGQNPRILKSGQTPSQVYQQLWDTLHAGGDWQGEFCNKKKNGELYWESASISPIVNTDGVLTHFLAVKEDITARKRAEQEIQRLNEDLQARAEELQEANQELEVANEELHVSNEELLTQMAERAHAEEELLRKRQAELKFSEQLAALQEFTNQLSEVESSSDVCRHAVEFGRLRLGFDRVGIWFVGERLGVVYGSFGIDESGKLRDERNERVEFGPESLTWHLLSRKAPVATMEQRPLYDHRGLQVGEGENAMAALWDGDEVIGLISVDNLLSRQPILEGQVEILRLYAIALGHLITRARAAHEREELLQREQTARAEAERNAERLTRLQGVTAALTGAQTVEEVATIIVDQGIGALGAQGGMLTLLDASRETLHLLRAVGYEPQVVDHWRSIPVSAPVAVAEAVRTSQPVWYESLEQVYARYPQLAPSARSGHIAFGAIPLSVNGQTIGGLGVSLTAPHTFDEQDRKFALALAGQAAQALERARLYEAEQQARGQAEAAVRLRDQFISVASHELRTPLTSTLGYAQLLNKRVSERDCLTPDERRMVRTIGQQAERLNKLISALLDISRIERGQLSLERDIVDLVALIDCLVEDVKPTLRKHTLEFKQPAEEILVEGDELRLEQVLQNLIQNAVKYSPLGGPVTLELSRVGWRARISVTDTGIGIPARSLPFLFNRFYRAENAEASHVSGLGVGLYVAHEIVRLHGGLIEVVSQEGKGSTFTVWLPFNSHSHKAREECNASPTRS